ncbi:MAG: tyrosine-type recombinase/integrase [Acidiferrobacterales bacterium]
MKCSSTADVQTLKRFLQAQRFRDAKTFTVYACVLRDFQCFVVEHAAGEPLSLSIVQKWLRERSLKWPLHMVCHRARLIERFLEWLQADGAITTNPFAALHRDYGQHTAAIVRALLSEDVEAALHQLRPVLRFGSFLGPLMREHVTQMRAIGYRYDVAERQLLRFDRFLQRHTELTGAPFARLIDLWSASRPNPQHLHEAQQVGHLLSKAMHRLDPSVAVLPIGADTHRRARQQQRRPYLYTEKEMLQVLQAALSFPSPMAPLRPLSLYTMVVLGYCVGLRLGEIVALTLADVHVQDETIDIRDTKFFKSRRLPVTSSVMGALNQYLAARQAAGAPMSRESGLFWNQQCGDRYSYGGIRNLLTQVLRRAGLKPARGRVGPRVHDLRHAMVGARMRQWYREGINPQSRLPYLATYLGHKDITSTLVYLNITPEVLHEASERFRAIGVQVLHTTGETP